MGYMVSDTSSIGYKIFSSVTLSHLMIISNRGEEGSSASTIRKGSRKFAQKPDYMTVVQLEKGTELEIVYLETGRPDSSQIKRQ